MIVRVARSRTKQTPPVDPIAELQHAGFDVLYVSHARSILHGEFADAVRELATVLGDVSLPISEIIGSGGGETKFTQRLRRRLSESGWVKHNFIVAKTIDGVARESTSHEVDHVKRVAGVGTLGLEIEWNNKDPFFSLQAALWDLVHRFALERRIVDVASLEAAGVTPTPKQRRNISLRSGRAHQPVAFAGAWTDNFVGNKFGQATTHWDKLMARVGRGVGNPCPLLLIGLPASIVVFDELRVEALDEPDETTPS